MTLTLTTRFNTDADVDVDAGVGIEAVANIKCIAKRVVDGTAASAQARATGAATRPLAELGWGFASQA